MEDIVAIKVVDEAGADHYFLTWGRVFDFADPDPLLAAVRPGLSTWGIVAPRALELCHSLQSAASQPYFYEALFSMSQQRIPFGPKHKSWQAAKRRQIKNGKEIYYLGNIA